MRSAAGVLMPDGTGGLANRDAEAVVAPGRDFDAFSHQVDYGPDMRTP
jgi:hypothetical protein